MLKIILILAIFISNGFARIPYTWGLFEATKPEYAHISPLWGFVALEGGMLEALRLYGNYSLSKDSQGRTIDEANPNDPVAQLIQKLFPSHDGANLTANTFMQDPVGFLSRHLESVNELISVLLSPNPEDKKSKIIDILKPKKEGKLVYGRGINAVSGNKADQFASTLLAAHGYTVTNGIPYPKETAIIALNAFFISIADKVEDLEKLTVLMKSGFKADKDLKSFSKTDYDAYHPRMEAIVKDANTNPELAFLMGVGEELYKLPFPKETLKHRGDTTITINDKKSLPFSDCVETSLRNFFWMVLHLKPGSLQNLLGNIESDNPNILSHSPSPYTKLKTFVLDEKLHGQSTHEAHCAWAEVVWGLNGADQSELSFDDVAYTQRIFEIRPHAEAENKRLGGIYNMFNVIAKLIPDPVFMESWMDGIDQPSPKDKKLVDKLNRKLTRLCTLTSSDLTHSLEGMLPFANVVFFYKSEKFIEWKFSHNHFQLNHLRESPDWRAPYYDYNFENEWLGACFNRLTAHQSQASLRLSYVFNSSIKKRNGLLAIIPHIYHHNSEPLKSLLSLWLKKANIFWYSPSAKSAIKVFADHFNDVHTRELFGQFPVLERRVLKYLMETNNAALLSKAPILKKDDSTRNTFTSSLALAVHKKTFEVVLGALDLWQKGNIDLELEEVKKCLLQTVEIFKPQEQKQLVDKILAHPALSKLGWKTQWSLWFKRQTSWVKKQVSGI